MDKIEINLSQKSSECLVKVNGTDLKGVCRISLDYSAGDRGVSFVSLTLMAKELIVNVDGKTTVQNIVTLSRAEKLNIFHQLEKELLK